MNKSCTRAYKLLFELNIDSNPELAFDYLHSLAKINSNFILIASKDILRLSSTHQNSSLDKKIYDMILNLSTVDSKKINILLHLFDNPTSRDIPEPD